jgi:serine carboxypeptidase-like clade 2
VIYLETPAGVGYSYSADAAYYQGVDDKMTGTQGDDSSIHAWLVSFTVHVLAHTDTHH